ncbi:unnamed protein product [Staurois parvus]|uniref:Uncharacterized protein n=1 Tax=Staurois parvus TaxID=386267 RepID=A0ABN9GW66_9NEOB|nr:unnamed protein product [Staurois parvus]
MKSPILGPGFGNGQDTDCTGVCGPFQRVRTRVLGSTSADRRAATRQAGGHCLEVRWKPKAARGCSGVAVC